MSSPTELSFDEILKFMLAHNGKVTNYDLVKYFKVFLTNPDMRDEARSTFKKHVNTLAIIKNQNNEKWLILKKKYMPGNETEENSFNASSADVSNLDDDSVTGSSAVDLQPQLPPQLNQDLNLLNTIIQQQMCPEPVFTGVKENIAPFVVDQVPKVPKRRSSASKSGSDKRSSTSSVTSGHRASIQGPDIISSVDPLPLTTSKSDTMLTVDPEHTISVKERKQMFNRMASEGDVLRAQQIGNNNNISGTDEDDRASIISMDHKADTEPLDPKQKAWILSAARGDYHTLARMCNENPKIVKTKTAMHWACKRGNEDLVKLLAGVSRNLVNVRTGYTPLHLATQFRHDNVYRLLVQVYDADPNIRDWSGKKPRHYSRSDTTLSPGTYRKKESFLRIGSLNVRVKKTTEAFSNFLGVGATRGSVFGRLDERRDETDQIHKTWGSANHLPEDKLMPPPATGKVRRRGAAARKASAAHSRSTPSTPDQPRARKGSNDDGDSDSDSAAGFHAAWRQRSSGNFE